MKLSVGALILIALVVPVILGGTHIHYMPDAVADSSLLVGLILASPVFGIGYLAYRFAKWHLRFHRRMKEPRR